MNRFSRFVTPVFLAATLLASAVLGVVPALSPRAQGSTAGPNATLSAGLDAAAGVANGVRTFGSSNGLERVPCLARDRGFTTVMAGAYFDGNPTNDTGEIARLKENIRKGCVTVAVIGSNATQKGWTVQRLANEVESLKQFMSENGIAGVQVTVGESFETYRDNPELVEVVDVVLVTLQPFYEGQATGVNTKLSATDSFVRTRAAYDWLHARYPDKTIVIGETGWPTAGGDERANGSAAATYLRLLLAWSHSAQVPVYVYSLADEPQLGQYESHLAHFGLYTSALQLKPGLAEVFPSACVVKGGQAPAKVGTIALSTPTCFAGVNFVNPATSTFTESKPACTVGSENYMATLAKKVVGISNANLNKIPVGLTGQQGFDTDRDGLSDLLESALGTSVTKIDTDGDGFNDRVEVSNGYSPLVGKRARLPLQKSFANKQKGKFFLQAEGRGQLWYVGDDGKRYLLATSPDAQARVCK